MTLGSLFDGSGGFPLAGVLVGITPIWSSEIEPYPLRVTAARFPDVKQLGDVTKINGAEIEPVDIITFGSPCQDLSVAGLQKGIHEGERSNLFFEAIRIIKEMRNADKANGRSGVDIRPRFAVWENVPGAFSSNKGEDFRAVLEAFKSVCDDNIPIPRPKRWGHAGEMVGDGWSLAWRVYDAQYWGVPQRRKRIYLIADFASERAGEILFEREGLRGNSAESGAPREGTADDAERGVGGGSLFEPKSLMEENWSEHTVKNALRANASKSAHCVVYPETARTLTARHDSSPCVDRGQNVVAIDCRNMVGNEELSATLQAKNEGGFSLNFVNPICYRNGGYGDMVEGVGTLRANGGDVGGARKASSLSVFENHSQDTRYNGPVDVSQTVSATFGMGGNNTPFVVEKHE